MFNLKMLQELMKKKKKGQTNKEITEKRSIPFNFFGDDVITYSE